MIEDDILSYIYFGEEDDLNPGRFRYEDISFAEGDFNYNTNRPRAHDRYSSACRRINKKVSEATNGDIERFLDFNTKQDGSVGINQELAYLSQK